MRVCDRKGCQERQARTITTEDQEIDLCAAHNNEFLEYISSPVTKEQTLEKKKKKRKKRKK